MAIDNYFHHIAVYGYRGQAFNRGLGVLHREFTWQKRPNFGIWVLGDETRDHYGIRAITAHSNGSNALWNSSLGAIEISKALNGVPVHVEFAGQLLVIDGETSPEDIEHAYGVRTGHHKLWERSPHKVSHCLVG